MAQKIGKPGALMADLQGPKIRVGKFTDGKIMLVAGEPFVLDAAGTEPGDICGVGLDYKELPRDVRPGDTLLLNDGLLKLTVESVRGDEVHTRVVLGGELSIHKGINKAGGGLTAPARQAQTVHWTVCVRARRLHLMRLHGVLARPPQIRPSCVRWWCLKSPSRPPKPRRLPSARRPACITARCG